MSRRLLVYYAIVVMVSAACSDVLDNLIDAANDPIPPWIETIHDDIHPQDAIGVTLDESVLWEPGDEIIELGNQVKESLRITVDGVPILSGEIAVLTGYGWPVTIYSDAGERLGAHGRNTHISFTPYKSPGPHTATLSVATTSGGVYAYTWTFLVTIEPDDGLPPWIKTLRNDLDSFDMIYIALDESEIWEPGDNMLSLGRQIGGSLQVIIDGRLLVQDNYELLLLGTFQMPIEVYDESGRSIGSHGDIFNIYITPSIAPGPHTATISVTSTSGIVYTHTWDFEYTGDQTE